MVDRLRGSAAFIRETAEESAHALKTPIGAIRQSLEPLRLVVPDSNLRGRRALEIIDQSCGRLGELVVHAHRSIDAAAQIADPPTDRIDLGATVAGLVEDMRGPSEQRNVSLRTDVEPNVVVIGGDEVIETIVENLIDNAISFSPPGTTVHVSVRAAGAQAILSVHDEGPGVDHEVAARMFEKGFSRRPKGRIDPEAAARENFGMGLWIVQRHVRVMGGSISAGNRPAGGLAMEVELPLAISD